MCPVAELRYRPRLVEDDVWSVFRIWKMQQLSGNKLQSLTFGYWRNSPVRKEDCTSAIVSLWQKVLPHGHPRIRLHQFCVCVTKSGPDLLCKKSPWFSTPCVPVYQTLIHRKKKPWIFEFYFRLWTATEQSWSNRYGEGSLYIPLPKYSSECARYG